MDSDEKVYSSSSPGNQATGGPPRYSAKPQHLVSTSVVGIADFKLHTPHVADSLGVRVWNWGNWYPEAFLDCRVTSPDGL
ncbi:hypothetical protein V2G26_016081 [Clonostachys chloroleuca]